MTALQNRITRMALLAVCSTALIAPLAALAQDAPPPPLPPAQGGGPGGRGGNMQEREARQLQMMSDQLNLTADQQAQAKQIFADSDAKISALFGNDSLSQDDRRSQMMALRTERETKIRAVLTPQQQPKYDEMVQRMHDRMGNRGGNGGNGGGNPPPPPPPQQ